MANIYIRANATGSATGADWNNAYTSLPASIGRGNVAYIASGSYGPYTFDDALSGTQSIWVKKATEADHGTDTGWNSSFGDSPALFSNATTVLTVDTAYFIIDGVTGSLNSGHGFKVNFTSFDTNVRGINVRAPNTTLSHIEVQGAGTTEVTGSNITQDGIYCNGYLYNSMSVDHCYIHDIKRCGVILSGTQTTGSGGHVIEHNYFLRTFSVADTHGQAIQGGPGVVSSATIRYNTFKDIEGTGVIVALDNVHTNWEVYGNTFIDENPTYTHGRVIGNTDGDTSVNFKIYNNTFYRLTSRADAAQLSFSTGSGNVAYNNLYFSCSTPAWTNCSHDYNQYYPAGGTGGDYGETNGYTGSGNPFVSTSSYNFRLASQGPSGTTLSSPYNIDPDGNTRGLDGVWNIGAYEYTGGGGETPVTNSYCIRADATGSGTGLDWNNAYTAIPATLTRGYTYWLASGSYSSTGYTCNDAHSGSSYITFKRAIQSSHGTSSGWSSTMGDGLAQIGPLQFDTGYYIFDGQEGGGPGSWESGFKLKIKHNNVAASKLVDINNSSSNHIKFYHVDFEHMGTTTETNEDTVYSLFQSDDLVFSYCYMHDVYRTMFRTIGNTNVTIEYTKFARNGSTGSTHREAISAEDDSYWIIRHCIFEDICNSAQIGLVNGSGTADGWEIYGNVFYYTPGYPLLSSLLINVSQFNTLYATNWKIYNNSIINLNGANTGIVIETGSNNVAYNNLWVGCRTNAVGFGNVDHDYNYFFDNYREGVGYLDAGLAASEVHGQVGTSGSINTSSFLLNTFTNAGLTLASPYNIDAFGNTRGSDGVWDRGAYEYTSGSTPPTGSSTPIIMYYVGANRRSGFFILA